MLSQEVVTPVPGFRRDRVTGVQTIHNDLEKLDSGFRRNDGKPHFWTFYEAVKFNHLGLIPRSLLRLCHSREGGNPGSDIFSGHPPTRV